MVLGQRLPTDGMFPFISMVPYYNAFCPAHLSFGAYKQDIDLCKQLYLCWLAGWPSCVAKSLTFSDLTLGWGLQGQWKAICWLHFHACFNQLGWNSMEHWCFLTRTSLYHFWVRFFAIKDENCCFTELHEKTNVGMHSRQMNRFASILMWW